MLKPLLLLRTCAIYILFLGILLVTALPLALLLAVMPEKKRWQSKAIFGLMGALYTGIVKCSFVDLTVTYEDEAVKQSSESGAVWIANPQSAYDIILLGYIQRMHPHFWFFWAKFLSTPVLGFFVSRLGVSVSQKDSRHDARSLLQAIKLLKEHHSNALIFPEGGRFAQVHKFTSGYLVLARKAGVPIVPVYIKGAGHVYPPFSFYFYAGPIHIVIGKPIVVTDAQTDEQIIEQVTAWYHAHES